MTEAVKIRKHQPSKTGQSGPFWPAWRSRALERLAGAVESPGLEVGRRRARASGEEGAVELCAKVPPPRRLERLGGWGGGAGVESSDPALEGFGPGCCSGFSNSEQVRDTTPIPRGHQTPSLHAHHSIPGRAHSHIPLGIWNLETRHVQGRNWGSGGPAAFHRDYNPRPPISC